MCSSFCAKSAPLGSPARQPPRLLVALPICDTPPSDAAMDDRMLPTSAAALSGAAPVLDADARRWRSGLDARELPAAPPPPLIPVLPAPAQLLLAESLREPPEVEAPAADCAMLMPLLGVTVAVRMGNSTPAASFPWAS